MSFDQKSHLKSVHENRKKETIEKIDKALTYMINTNQTINFSRVAKEANVGKSTLYTLPKVKEKIAYYRELSIQKNYKTQEFSKKDIKIQSLKRKIKKLEDENKELKLSLKKAYGEIFENTHIT